MGIMQIRPYTWWPSLYTTGCGIRSAALKLSLPSSQYTRFNFPVDVRSFQMIQIIGFSEARTAFNKN